MDSQYQTLINPFIKVNEITHSQYVASSCSLNRGIMAKVPLDNKEYDIQGRYFKDIFSTGLIVNDIRAKAADYKIDISGFRDSYLPLLLERYLLSKDVVKKELAKSVLSDFGSRLGLIFLALRLGEKPNRDARPQWHDEHWQYWKNLKRIILVGGLASGMLGRSFKEHIFYVFDHANVKPYEIKLFDNGTYVGIQGASKALMDDNTSSLVLDLGHTNIKMCIVKKENGRITSLKPFESVSTPFMNTQYRSQQERFDDSIRLHRYLVNLISDTYKTSCRKYALSDKIVISIANYNSKGILNSIHGGYAKLSMLGDDYEKLLNEDISSELHRKISVSLIHDGTANALYFSEMKDCVCISLGTAFGIGFPDIKIG